MILVVFYQFSGENTEDIGLTQQNSPIFLFFLDSRTVQCKSRSHFRMDWAIYHSSSGISTQICIVDTYRKSKKSIVIHIEPKITNDMQPYIPMTPPSYAPVSKDLIYCKKKISKFFRRNLFIS